MDVEDIEIIENNYPLYKKSICEFMGTLMLVSSIIGSGIMGDELSIDNGVALLGNTISTVGMLYIIINIFGDISGAHFNPLVTLMFWFKKEITSKHVLFYIPSQIMGGISGTVIAHVMFNYAVIDFPGSDRDSKGEFISEIVSTFGLLTTIHGLVSLNKKEIVPNAVSMYIMSGYWYTLSTCFANPAVTIARTLTPTFAGISIKSWPVYFGGQTIGFFIAIPFSELIFKNKTLKQSIEIFKI